MSEETQYEFASKDYSVDYTKIGVHQSNLQINKIMQPNAVSFMNEKGDEVGRFTILNNRITFSGLVDETILVFLQYLYKMAPRKYNCNDFDKLTVGSVYESMDEYYTTSYDNVYWDSITEEYLVMLDDEKTSVVVSGKNRAKWAKMISIVAKDIDLNEEK